MSSPSKNEETQILAKLAKDFHDLVTDKDTLRKSVESFLDSVIDELTLGVIFDLHRKYKTHLMDENVSLDNANSNSETFTNYDLRKTQNCVCPICDREVVATKFAPHLASCMGLGRTPTTRRGTSSATKEQLNSAYSGATSDDEDDVSWSSGNRSGKKKRRNGAGKRSKGVSTRKMNDSKTSIAEADTSSNLDDVTSLQELLQESSGSSSPAESVSSNNSNSPKKRERTKMKKFR